MKILHYSDASEPSFLNLYRDCDVLVTTGDLSLIDLLPIEELTEKKMAFGVYGNHDAAGYLERLHIVNLHQRTFQYNGYLWGGFQGCLRYKNGQFMFTQDEAEEWAETFPYVDVLLLHAGPKDMLDDPNDSVHAGSLWVRKYVLEKQPQYIFLGHQYSNADLNAGKTNLFRTFGARMIEIDDKN